MTVYLDNAATSYPKPDCVTAAVEHCIKDFCGNPGRGAHTVSRRAAECVYQCREKSADFFGLSEPEGVIFTLNTTMSLNLLLKGALKEGDHVLISDMEHNAVLRPLNALAAHGVTYDTFPTYPEGCENATEKLLDGIKKRLRPNTRLLCCAHASNICSASLPLADIGALCRQNGILFCVDGAQSAGHLPINMQKMQIDALCIPGHKGLFSPPGVGALLLSPNLSLETLLEGGSGYDSRAPFMPDEPPERYEAGTLPLPAIAGLSAGLDFVRACSIDAIHAHETLLTERLKLHLHSLPGIKIYAPHRRGGVLLFSADGIPSEALAASLDRYGFCTRAGLHCAPLAHTTLATPPDGAIRVSPSIFNTLSDIDAFAKAVREIL